MADRDQLHRALAFVARACRPAWDERGILTELSKHEAEPIENVIRACIDAATTPSTETPGGIGARLRDDGWTTDLRPKGKDPNDKPAYYGPTAQFCREPIAGDDGQPRQCRMLLHPDEPCTHGRSTGRRKDQIIAQLRQDIADAQGAVERAEGEQERKREEAKL